MVGKRREEHEEKKQLDRIEENTIEILGILSRRKLSRGRIKLMAKTIFVGGTSTATLALLDQNGKPDTLTINTVVQTLTSGAVVLT